MSKLKFENETYRIFRETRASPPHKKYDFVLYDFRNGEEIITATELESQSNLTFELIDNWTSALKNLNIK